MNFLYSLKDISLNYNLIGDSAKDQKIAALKNLTLEIHENELLVILGANGSGKSSLAKLLAGLADDFTGEISYRGIKITHYDREVFSDVALILQEPQNQVLMPTVAAEIAFSLENRGIPQDIISQKVKNMASRFGLNDMLDKSTDQLSGGQITTLALAASLVTNPKIIILDEPDSHLDYKSKKVLTRFIAENKGKITIVVISQYPGSTQTADRCLVLDDGKCLACGPPGEVLNDQLLMEKCHLKITPESKKLPVFKRNDGNIAASDRIPVLVLEDISYAYEKNIPVLKNINLEIYSGERIGLIGPSGSGKTTLGLIIAGLLKPEQGRVLHEGKSIGNMPIRQLRRLVTMALQFPERALIEETVASDIAFGPRNLEYQNSESIVANMLKQFHIDHLGNRHPFTLSGGQKRRAALAGVMAIDSSILIFDEPTAALDPAATIEFLSFLIGHTEKTLVIISHDRELIGEVCTRAVEMDNGEIKSFGL
jgi:energy-coupling factor transport system ATP-binding protein